MEILLYRDANRTGGERSGELRKILCYRRLRLHEEEGKMSKKACLDLSFDLSCPKSHFQAILSSQLVFKQSVPSLRIERTVLSLPSVPRQFTPFCFSPEYNPRPPPRPEPSFMHTLSSHLPKAEQSSPSSTGPKTFLALGHSGYRHCWPLQWIPLDSSDSQ